MVPKPGKVVITFCQRSTNSSAYSAFRKLGRYLANEEEVMYLFFLIIIILIIFVFVGGF